MQRFTVTYYASAVIYVTVEADAANADAAEYEPLSEEIASAIEQALSSLRLPISTGSVTLDLRRTGEWEILNVRGCQSG